MRQGRATYAVDEDYFAVIDTEEKAYWLGLIAADGCVLSPRPGKAASQTFTLSLKAEDSAHVEAFRAAIGYTGPLFQVAVQTPSGGRVTHQCRITVNRQRFCRNLASQGITPRKTWTLTPPDGNVPAGLLRHYWRGFVDGDGCVTVSKTEQQRGAKYTWSVGVVGTREMAHGFAAFVRANADVRLNVYSRRTNFNGKSGGTLWTAKAVGVQSPQAVARLLYDGATVSLPRKRALVDQLLAAVPKRNRVPVEYPNRERRRGDKNMVYTLLTHSGETLPVQEWSKRLGIPSNTILGRLARGDSPERALRPPDARHRTVKSHPRVTAHGQTLSVPQWARKLGIGVSTIYLRLGQGATPDEALKPVGRQLTVGGETRSLAEWSKVSGVKYTTIKYRLKRGETPEEALRPVS